MDNFRQFLAGAVTLAGSGVAVPVPPRSPQYATPSPTDHASFAAGVTGSALSPFLQAEGPTATSSGLRKPVGS